MTTGAELIRLSLKTSGVFGVGQTPLGEDTLDAKTLLNMMIGQWNRRRWLVYHLVDTAHQCNGAISYSVGPGGDFNIARPDQIEAAFMRQINTGGVNQVDYPMRRIESREDYSRITLKVLNAPPSTDFFYDSGYPMGQVFPWPLATNRYELHIITKAPLARIDDLAADIVLPSEYEEALYTNLVIRLRSAYQMPADPVQVALAKAALNTIRNANGQVSTLGMPAALQQNGRYNILSDGNSSSGGS